ncbi:MAG: hypothetical protein AB7F35_09195 [Acetobacteraceae bacterium]
MPVAHLTRRMSLLLPFALAACGTEEPREFPPLSYDYLPQIQLDVGTVEIEQRFIPSGRPPDVSQLAPVRPVDALRTMAQERLRAFGTNGRAVFAIQDASLKRTGDVIDGSMAVILTIYRADGAQGGNATARVTRRNTGRVNSLRGTLYDMVKAMMDDMNVELEYQIRRNLREWLTTATAPETPVEQTPLETPPRR